MKYFYSFVILLMYMNSSIAQDSCKTKKNELRHGIQFQINGILNLGNFNDYTFSYRYLLNKKSGIRISFLTKHNSNSTEGTLLDDTLSYKIPSTNYGHNLKLSIQYLHSILEYEKFSLVFGGGIFISYDKLEHYYERRRTNYFSSTKKFIEGLGYGLDLIVGVEYYLYKNVIISGEYGVNFSLTFTDYEEIQHKYDSYGERFITRRQNRESKLYKIDSQNVNLGIAIFF